MQRKVGIVLLFLGVAAAAAALPYVYNSDGRGENGIEPAWRDSKSALPDTFGFKPTRTNFKSGSKAEAIYELGEPVKLPTGGEPAALAVGDFTGDGLDDVAVLTRVTFSDSRVVLFVQQPGGGLAWSRNYSIVQQNIWIGGIRAGDLNNDGVMDIVVTHTQGLFLLTSQPDGELAAGEYLSAGLGDDLGLVDADRDGFLDVVAKSTDITVFYGDGRGGIRGSTALAPITSVSDIEVGDVTGDDLPDIVTSGGAGMEVRPLIATGGFGPPRAYDLPGGWSPNGVAIGDFNSDGRNDIGVTRGKNSPTQVWMFYQNAQGTMNPSVDLPTYDIPDDAFSADLDRDGRADLIVSHSGWTTRGYYLQGDNGLLPEKRFMAINNWNSSNGMGAGDLNNDGCGDLAYVESGGLSIRLGSNCYVRPLPRVVNDIDGDGMTDMLWRNEGKTDFAYWLMDGPQRRAGYGYAVGPAWNIIAKGDFNGDGALDLVWSDGQSMQLWQRYEDSYQGLVMPAYPQGYRVVATGDVDGDGKSDLLWRDETNSVLALWVMEGAWPRDGRAYGLPPAWRIAATGDLNGDRRLDLVLTNGTRMDLWRGARNLLWESAAMGGYPAGWELKDAADIDGDGREDLLWRHAELGYFVYWRMAGPRRTYGREYRVDGTWRVLDSGDYNGDGKADIVWTNGALMQLWASGEGEAFAGLEMPAYPRGWTLQ